MELKIKNKMKNGSLRKGVINEILEEVVPFEYANITIDKNYFICEREDGRCSLYDQEGRCLLSYLEGYYSVKVLNKRSSSVEMKAYNQNGEVGILNCDIREENGTYTVKNTISYPFGKADQIEENREGQVELYKFVEGSRLIGFWRHSVFGTVDPSYLSWDYHKWNTYQSPVPCVIKRDNGKKKIIGNFSISSERRMNKVYNYLEEVIYSKRRKNKICYGIKQFRMKIKKDSSLLPSFEIVSEDLLPATFSGIEHFEQDQLYLVEQTIRNQKKYGFIGYSLNWNLEWNVLTVWGDCTKKIQIKSSMDYDEINLIRETGSDCSYDYDSQPSITHAIVKKDGKYGLLRIRFAKITGDYDYLKGEFRRDFGIMEEMALCIYDSIEKLTDDVFVGTIGDRKKLISNYKDKEENFISTKLKYIDVEAIKQQSFICTLEDGRKEYVKFSCFLDDAIGEYGSLEVTPSYPEMRIYNLGKEEFFVKGFLEKSQNSNFDLYDSKAKLRYSNVSSIKVGPEIGLSQIDMLDGENQRMAIVNNFGIQEFEVEGENLGVSNIPLLGLLKVEYGSPENRRVSFKKLNSRPCPETSKLLLDKEYFFFHLDYTQENTKESVLLAYYCEVSNENKRINHFVRKVGYQGEFITLLEGSFSLKKVVLNGKRSIVSLFDPTIGKERYGVIENKKGNICISYEFDNIEFDEAKKIFIATQNGTEFLFDEDGFELSQPEKKYELK